jgi:hypothetical protein
MSGLQREVVNLYKRFAPPPPTLLIRISLVDPRSASLILSSICRFHFS